MANNIHTVYNSDKHRWENKSEGNSDPLSWHHTKDNAEDRAQNLAEDRGVEHFIHGRDGKIQERNSYGSDPFPPRG